MPDISSGIETGNAAELDINTQAGWDAAMQAKGIAPDPEGVASDTSVASGLTYGTDPTAPPRDPDTGRFAPAPQAAPAQDDPASVDTSAAPEDADSGFTSDDAEVAAYLAKYNGDAGAALKAAANAQSLIGRQGQDLGATREELAELRGRLEALQTVAQQAPTQYLNDEQVQEQAMLAASQKGYFAAATDAANASLASGDERLYRELLSNWQVDDAFAAMDFHTKFTIWQSEQAASQNTVEDPRLAAADELLQQNLINDAVGAIAQERASTFQTFGPFVTQAFEQVPAAVQAMVTDPDPAVRLDGMRMVADRATLLASAASPATPAASVPETPAPAFQRNLAGAQVATSALRPVAPAEGGAADPNSREARLAAFYKEFEDTTTTNIADGLTYGK